jgi:hypothetical protein
MSFSHIAGAIAFPEDEYQSCSGELQDGLEGDSGEAKSPQGLKPKFISWLLRHD